MKIMRISKTNGFDNFCPTGAEVKNFSNICIHITKNKIHCQESIISDCVSLTYKHVSKSALNTLIQASRSPYMPLKRVRSIIIPLTLKNAVKRILVRSESKHDFSFMFYSHKEYCITDLQARFKVCFKIAQNPSQMPQIERKVA